MNFKELDNTFSGVCYICALPGSKTHDFTVSVDNTSFKTEWVMNSKEIICVNCFFKRLSNTLEGLLSSQ